MHSANYISLSCISRKHPSLARHHPLPHLHSLPKTTETEYSPKLHALKSRPPRVNASNSNSATILRATCALDSQSNENRWKPSTSGHPDLQGTIASRPIASSQNTNQRCRQQHTNVPAPHPDYPTGTETQTHAQPGARNHNRNHYSRKYEENNPYRGPFPTNPPNSHKRYPIGDIIQACGTCEGVFSGSPRKDSGGAAAWRRAGRGRGSRRARHGTSCTPPTSSSPAPPPALHVAWYRC